MHHAHVLLGRAQVAGILEGDPGVAGLEQHGQHLAPQLHGGNALEQTDLAPVGLGLVGVVGDFEFLAELVVQVGHVAGGEEGPLAAVDDPLHEQVGNPVGGVHVVGAAALVAGVLAQLEEFLDVQMPGFQIGADGALALAALVHGHGRVIHHLEEGDDALALAVGALDAGPQGAHRGPVVAQAAGVLLQQGVFLDGLVDAFQVVGDGGEVAGGELGMPGAAVEQGRRAAHEVEGGEQVVELDGPGFPVDLVEGQAHGHAHEEGLGQLDAALVHVQEVAVVEGLQAQVVELQVPLGLEGGGQAFQVVVLEAGIQQLGVHAGADEAGEGFGVAGGHGLLAGFLAQHFDAHAAQQQAGSHLAVARFPLDQGAGGQHQGLAHGGQGHAVVEVVQGLFQHRFGGHVGQALAGFPALLQQGGPVQGEAAVAVHHVQQGAGGSGGGRRLGGPFGGPLFPVQHVGPGHVVLAGAHQGQFHLVLDVFDMHRAAAGQAPGEGLDDDGGEAGDQVPQAGRGGALAAVHGQEGLVHGDGDFFRIEGHYRTVAADDLEGLGPAGQIGGVGQAVVQIVGGQVG